MLGHLHEALNILILRPGEDEIPKLPLTWIKWQLMVQKSHPQLNHRSHRELGTGSNVRGVLSKGRLSLSLWVDVQMLRQRDHQFEVGLGYRLRQPYKHMLG